MNGPAIVSHSQKALAAWGDDLPTWILRLAEEADQTSQAKVATKLGYSPAVVSQVIGNKYPGNVASVEEAWRSAFRGMMIACPQLGDITAMDCRDWRDKARSFANTNGQRVTMFRACRACARFTVQPEGEL